MRLTASLALAALIATSATSSIAAGLIVTDTPATPAPAPAPVVVVDTPPPSGSFNSGYIILGLLGALVAASASY